MKKIEFSKVIVIWAMSFVTTLAFFLSISWLLKDRISLDILELVTTVIQTVIVSYTLKAGVENYGKIKSNKQDDHTTGHDLESGD